MDATTTQTVMEVSAMASINVADIIKAGERQVAEKQAKEKEIAATRSLLRNLVDSKVATPDEAARVAELFPYVKRTRTPKPAQKVAA